MRPRRVVRAVLIGLATGALMVTAAWAGAGLGPVTDTPTEAVTDNGDRPAAQTDAANRTGDATGEGDQAATAESGSQTTDAATSETETAATGATIETAGSGAANADLDRGEYLVGAAKVSIEPRPDDYDGTWVKDRDKCATLSQTTLEQLAGGNLDPASHLASAGGSPWPENPNCIYMGGFGIGPMNPVTSWNQEYGLWIRSVAIADGADTLVLTLIDGEGYFWDYNNKCDDCGIKQLSAQLGQELGIDPAGLVFASTHAHSSPDFIGGWGFVPDWYMTQVADSIRTSVRRAVDAMQPARLEVGEALARPFNRERRGTYRSAEEQQLTWLRAYVPGETTTSAPGNSTGKGEGDGNNGTTTTSDAETIATIGGYAAHPTAFGTNDGEAHPDWPGVFEKRLEENFGGIGFHFMTGLGNLSEAGLENVARVNQLADLIPTTGQGTQVQATDVRTARTTWNQPVTNVPLSGLGLPGFFDRQFNQQPASLRTGKNPETAPCVSSSAVSVEVPAAAARVGDLFAVSTNPGEIFANASNTVKEKSGAQVTMPLGQANDALGYMPQQFEMHEAGQQGAGFVADGVAVVNYEDSYAIDRCFGDKSLEANVDLLGQIAGD